MSGPAIIIISECNPMIYGVLRVEFSRWNFAVLLAASSEEAHTFASQAIASLVVLDVGNSHFSAYAACARIRRRDGYATRPIVVTVQEVCARSIAAAEMAGATALLPKPYSVTDLVRAVTPHLPADDPLLLGQARAGEPAPPTQEWKRPGSLDWPHSGEESALSMNRLLLPIVRGGGRKIPFGGKVS
jgi:DNA-binding response OmpR family regulator